MKNGNKKKPAVMPVFLCAQVNVATLFAIVTQKRLTYVNFYQQIVY